MTLHSVLARIAMGTLAVQLSVAALAATPAAAPAAFKADPAKGQALSQTCVACHSADASRGAPANPILQGQHPEYLARQLADFKSGKRKNAVMQGMVASLSSDDMQHLAAFYAGKVAKPGFAKVKDTVARGEQLYRGGHLGLKIPACAGCHSPTGAGIPAQFPRLAGQHADYTEAQLLAFRSGARGNNPQMATIANKMNDRDIKAVADYIAGLR